MRERVVLRLLMLSQEGNRQPLQRGEDADGDLRGI